MFLDLHLRKKIENALLDIELDPIRSSGDKTCSWNCSNSCKDTCRLTFTGGCETTRLFDTK